MIGLPQLNPASKKQEEAMPLIDSTALQIPTIAENTMYRGEESKCSKHEKNCCTLVKNSCIAVCATACLVGNVATCIIMSPYERAFIGLICLSGTVSSLYAKCN